MTHLYDVLGFFLICFFHGLGLFVWGCGVGRLIPSLEKGGMVGGWMNPWHCDTQ
jgi:hypothetical protein